MHALLLAAQLWTTQYADALAKIQANHRVVAPAATAAPLPATPAEQYALAVKLESETVRLYGTLRGGEPIPMPVRPPFVVEKTNPVLDAPKAGKKTTPKAPSLEDVMDEATATKAPPVPPPTIEELMQARWPQMEAMVAQTKALADLVARRAGPTVEVQRGLRFDDPLFGPWYGTGTVTTVSVAPGVQDWPFVAGWQFLGPFDFPATNLDALRLPDCVPVTNTDYAGKVGPVRWRPAKMNPAGCAVFSDVEALEEVSEVAAEQAPDTPAPKKVWPTAVYFGAATLDAERDLEIILAAGCGGRLSVWVDEVLVARGPTTDDPGNLAQEALVFRAKLKRGANRLLVRCETPTFGLFTHRRPGTGSYFWMRACVRGAPGSAVTAKPGGAPGLPANVRGFRGDQTGYFPEADPVTAWDIERGINVRWIAPIERWSKASPVVVGDRVFVCAEPHVLVCLDALTGKVLWRRTANVLDAIDPALGAASEKLHQAFLDAKAAVAPKLAELGPDYAARLRTLAGQGKPLPQAVADLRGMERDAEKAYRAFFDHLNKHAKLVSPAWDGHYTGPWLGYTFATPVTDGRRVFVQFRTGATAAFDLDGNRLWLAHTPYTAGGVGVCSSPVLADDNLVISQPNEGSRSGAAVTLLALDANTGKVAWRTQADSRSQVSSPVVMRLTNGKQTMAVVVTDGGTVVRADDGKVLVSGLQGGCGTGSPTPVGDVLYRIELAQGGAVQLVMLDRDTVGARWLWSCGGLYNSIYAGFGHVNGMLFGTTHGGSQCINKEGLNLISTVNGQPVERPFNADARQKKEGIFAVARGGFIPPVASPRAIYLAVRGQWHASSLAEELPNKWQPYTYVTVAQPGGLGRFIAHNKVVGPMTPHLALAGDRVYLRNDQELACFGYTGDEGKAYEAEVNAATILADIPDNGPLWREGVLHAKPFLEKVIALKPDCAAAQRARVLLGKAEQ